MSNERFRDLKIGDKVFIYCHEEIYSRIKEVLVTEIKGSVVYPNLSNNITYVDGITATFSLIGEKQKEKQTFFIRFNEEKSRRGTLYTGFLTIDDALEFAEFMKDQKIESLQKEIEELNNRYNKLLITFGK